MFKYLFSEINVKSSTFFISKPHTEYKTHCLRLKTITNDLVTLQWLTVKARTHVTDTVKEQTPKDGQRL